MECYKPTVDSSKSHMGGWVGGCLLGVPLHGAPVGPQVMRTDVPPLLWGGGLCPKTLCWGLRWPYNEVEVGLSLERRICGFPGSPPKIPPLQPTSRRWWWARMSSSCSWWAQAGDAGAFWGGLGVLWGCWTPSHTCPWFCPTFPLG